MLHKRLTIKMLFLAILLLAGSQAFAEPTIDEGKALFKANCGSCHAKDMVSKSTGPALAGMEDRWADYPREDLYTWVRNSQKLIADGHPRATELWNEWKPTVMNPFPNLTDEQIESIILYVNNPGSKVAAGPAAAGPTKAEGPGTGFYLGLVGVLALLAFILSRIVMSLNRMAARKDGVSEADLPGKTLVEQLLSPGVIAFAIFLLVLVGGYTTVNNAMDLGRQKDYQPAQPIKFSHVTHAGVNKIDCQYCHDGARRSKHSVIPATNTCMNCHSDIKKGSTYGTAELGKIFASAGYNPEEGKYFEDYANMPEEEISAVFKRWIEASYVEAKGEDIDGDGTKEVSKTRLKNEVDKQWGAMSGHVNRPIEWIKIHNLPDHVYFNHAQHVSVGEVECQTCHGPVEEMEVVQQYAPLSMGWCVNCHRETEVQFADNPYYDSYEEYHKEMKHNDPRLQRQGVTVEEIGGLECQKCHY
jgi:mono/diheme cytochrome c family protein